MSEVDSSEFSRSNDSGNEHHQDTIEGAGGEPTGGEQRGSAVAGAVAVFHQEEARGSGERGKSVAITEHALD